MSVKFADYFFEHHRRLSNYAGTAILAWLLSALCAQGLALLIPQGQLSVATASSESMEDAASLFTADAAASVETYLQICERNIFDSQKRTVCTEEALSLSDVEVEPATDLNSPPIKSDLNAKLLGTMVMSGSASSFATIAPNSGKDSQTFRVGDTLMKEAKIYEIQRNIVYFVRNGRREYIEVSKIPLFSRTPAPKSSRSSSAGIERNGNNVTISKAKVDATLQDMNKVIQQSRMVPNYENGKVTGFKVFAIRKESIFDQLGLKNGDIIQRINGTTIDSIEKALPMLEIVKTESNVKIDLVRRGSKQTLNVNIQ